MAGNVEALRSVAPLEQYRIAFIESTDLVAIAKAFRRIPGPRFREKVRVAVAGPVHPSDEKKSGSKARDFLFELSVAASFRNRKLPVLTCTDKDVITRVSGHTLLIECKRPQSKNKVRRSIENATAQLMEHLKNPNRGATLRGLIVLDISIIMNPQRMFLVTDSEQAIVAEINALFARFYSEFKSALRHGRDRRILGVLVFVKVLGYHRLENNHIGCLGTQIFIHAAPRTYNAILTENFYLHLTRDSAR